MDFGWIGALWLVFCGTGIALSTRSSRYTWRVAPWTTVGWLLTNGYFLTAFPKAWGAAPPFHLDYAFVAGLTIAFIVAGVRDEAQAEPWYWPTCLGRTRREAQTRRPH